MKIRYVIVLLLLIGSVHGYSQVGMNGNNPNKSAALDLDSNNKGFLMPRISLLSSTDNVTINFPAKSLLIYNTANRADVVEGFYFWDSAKWVKISSKTDPVTETLTTLLSNGAGTYTYKSENGTQTVINVATDVKLYETLTALSYNQSTKNLAYTNEKGVINNLDLSGLSPAYTAGTNITITGNVISAVDNDTKYTATSPGISLTGTVFSVPNATAQWNANQLQGSPIAITAPAVNQFLGWSGTNWTPTSVPQNNWRIAGTTNPSTSNSENIYQMGNVSVGTTNASNYKFNVFGGNQLINGSVTPTLNFLSNGTGNTNANSQGRISFWEAGGENTWGGGLEFNSPAQPGYNTLDIYGMASSVKKTVASFDVQNGRLGIGTTTPGVQLDVIGKTRSSIFIVDNGFESGDYTKTTEINFVRNTTNDRWVIGSSLNGRGNDIFELAHLTGGNLFQNRVFVYDRVSSSFAINQANPNTAFRFYVNGAAGGTTAWTQSSDKRYKKDITPITNALNKILKIEGVEYNWKKDEFKEMSFDGKHQLGVIAQDIQKVLPEAVTIDEKGYYSVSYTTLVPVLVEAIKEQQVTISANEGKIKELQKQQTMQQQEMDTLKKMIQELIAKK